jgi:pilus assembly protein TadC
MKTQEKKRTGKKNPLPIIALIISLIIGLATYYYSKSIIVSIISIITLFVIILVYGYMRASFIESSRVKQIELVFPDFLQLMASNLRAGMTIDRALLSSSRKEFAPLDLEISRLGKDIVTGKEMERAMIEMSERIKSEKIRKTTLLIISGIRSGGNLAVLLQETAANMREHAFIEKRAASNVLMYVIFIFFAVAIGAPLLFGLSTVLVSILSQILATIPKVQTNASLPFTLTAINISPTFITYFSAFFILVTDVLGSLVLGLVSRGEEKAGVRYIPFLVPLSLGVFFVVKVALSQYFLQFFG